MAMEIVLATRNKKKIEEIRRILEDTGMLIFTLNDFPGCPEVEESENSFKANAVKKAIAVAGYTGKASIADDSGLEVYVLGGAPGVMSARYAGEGADDNKNIEKLLGEMRSLGEAERGARFVCVIALAFPDGKVKTFPGFVKGKIGIEPKGRKGFGYDPVFYPEGESRTFAEMDDSEKDALSHRSRALRELRRYLEEKQGEF
ncbi:MAG: XTP/dITP diphosphatase [Nitrospirota bacterium]